jgi:hypothetical protein
MMPDWARKMTGTYHSSVMERFILRPNEKLKSRLVRWAVGELPCKTMALARVSGAAPRPASSDISNSRQQYAA